MILNYDSYEKAVYDWLLEKNEIDRTFCFSTRLRASKGSEHKYFIGTRRSGYFGTTFWLVPVSFPGSSTDLINVMFNFHKGAYQCYIQFGQTRAPHDEQNREALLFIKQLKDVLKTKGVDFWENDPANKMEYYSSILSQGQMELQNFFSEIDTKLMTFVGIIDEFLSEFKKTSNIDGNRISEELFLNKFQRSLNARLLAPVIIDVESDNSDLNETVYKPHIYKFPPNQILYGPPGTGKTYSTIEKALLILGEDLDSLPRSEVKNIFDEYVNENRIVFTTFHQSLSYEDFIEGIKPLKPDASLSIKYDVVDGIFKELAIAAKSNFDNSQVLNSEKLSFEEAFQKLQLEWESNQAIKFSVKTPGYEYTIIGFTATSIQFRKASGGTSHTLSINTLRDIYYGKDYSFKQGVGIYYPGILNKLNGYDRGVESVGLLNYVLIIDEINRGNVSHIFGELITLIEESKRAGMPEALEVTLPYSKDKFSIPLNLYIIGTMNTADRSVESLDTALRRRFSFEEMMPNYHLLSNDVYRYDNLVSFNDEYGLPEWVNWSEDFKVTVEHLYAKIGLVIEINSKEESGLWDVINEANFQANQNSLILGNYKFNYMLDLGILLETINKRIEILYDREHQIGHSFFLKIQDRMNPYPELRNCFKNEIIPLLQEYFFGDYEKIGLVLGEGFVTKTNPSVSLFPKFSGSNPADFVNPIFSINQNSLAYSDSFITAISKLTGKDQTIESV